jgi:hypothetical protein
MKNYLLGEKATQRSPPWLRVELSQPHVKFDGNASKDEGWKFTDDWIQAKMGKTKAHRIAMGCI